MNHSTFMVEDYVELLALQRVFREAKFCTEADDVEISDSPIVARMFERLIEAVIFQEVARDGEGARKRWEEWLAIDESRDEWWAAVRRAQADNRWFGFSSEERKNYVRVLLSPFKPSPEATQRFVETVDHAK